MHVYLSKNPALPTRDVRGAGWYIHLNTNDLDTSVWLLDEDGLPILHVHRDPKKGVNVASWWIPGGIRRDLRERMLKEGPFIYAGLTSVMI